MEVISKIDYDFTMAEKDKMMQMGVIGRTIVLDSMVSEYISKHPDCTIVNIASGMDTRFNRLDNGKIKWYNVDLENSAKFRLEYLPDTERVTTLAYSAMNPKWASEIEASEDMLFIIEGLTMYLTKQDNSDIKLADAILGYIATNARNSIRELEGAYNRVTLFSRMSAGPGIEITMDMAEEALKDFISDENSVQLSAENIIDIVCNHFNVDKDLLLSERRTDEIAYPRQICMYLCSEYTSLTQQVIAEKLHRKNHTTVNHAVKKIKSDLSVDKELQATISMLKKKLNIK